MIAVSRPGAGTFFAVKKCEQYSLPGGTGMNKWMISGECPPCRWKFRQFSERYVIMMNIAVATAKNTAEKVKPDVRLIYAAK